MPFTGYITHINKHIFTTIIYTYTYHVHSSLSIYLSIYDSPHKGLSTLAKELTAAVRVMESSANVWSWYPVMQNLNNRKLLHNAW